MKDIGGKRKTEERQAKDFGRQRKTMRDKKKDTRDWYFNTSGGQTLIRRKSSMFFEPWA
jgi:hypothetical protein